MKTHIKFATLIAVVIGTLAWLAAGGIRETKTYYKTVQEVREMGDAALERRVRVAGDVKAGSIIRMGREVIFVLEQGPLRLQVVYDGTEPLPDTFRDGAQAMADGTMGPGGVFRATKIQAKCASKYEAKPGKNTSTAVEAGI